MLKVVNKRSLSSTLGFKEVYIGRPSFLGNPFVMESEQQREAAVQAYRLYLWECIKLNNNKHVDVRDIAAKFQVKVSSKWLSIASSQIYQELMSLAEESLIQDVALVCWCNPKACHGDMIVRACAWLLPF